MKKHILCFFMICILSAILCGCGNAIPELTQEESDMVANYAAATLLKYDSGYQSRLLNEAQLEEEENTQNEIRKKAEEMADLEKEKELQKEEKAEQSKAETIKEDVAVTDPAEFLGLDGLTVSYNGVDFVDQYSESGDDLYFTTNASEGCKLAVLHLSIVNRTSEVKMADIFDTNAYFKVSFDGENYHRIMSTLFAEDFSVYNEQIEPGASADTVILLELPTEECINPETVVLYIRYQNEILKTRLK